LREIRLLQPGETVWDSEVLGFCSRRQQSDAITYGLKKLLKAIVGPALAVRHLCLSAQVAEPLAGASHIMIAARPDEAALIELLPAGPG
jgi:hypothetical protein